MISYISVKEASGRSSWSEEELVYLCEQRHLLGKKIGSDWYIAAGAVEKIDPSLARGWLREKIRSGSSFAAELRRESRARDEVKALQRSLMVVMAMVMIGGLTAWGWGLATNYQIAVDLPEFELASPDLEIGSNLAAAYTIVRPEAGAVLGDLGSALIDLPDLLLYAKERVVINWKNFLGVESEFANNTSSGQLNRSPLLTSSSTDAIAKYIDSQISKELKGLVPQAGRTVTAPNQGVVVVPSTGDRTTDAEILQHLRNTFSDQVVVRTDSSGLSGVITPNFSKLSDDQYLFLLTPIRR